MKLTIILIFAFVMAVQASGNAQNITLSAKNVPITKLLDDIVEQTNYRFLYNDDLLNRVSVQHIQVTDANIQEVLDKILIQANLSYRIRSGTITILPAKKKVHITTAQVKQERVEVRGQVTDSLDILHGVSVTVKGQQAIGTSTDVNGRYTLMVPPDAVLIFQYIGYHTQEIAIKDRNVIDVMLQQDLAGLEEIVIVGFGEQKKESVVSSVSSIKGEELRMPNRSLSNNLAGQIPGLIAVQRTGDPGRDDAEFWIRGVSSFAGGTSPLVLVDGVPRNMNDIEPDEIETFTLLKDAAATAVYGAEGANGVVLITSKRGRTQKTDITYRGEYSLSSPTRVPDFANSVEYLTLYNEALRNEGRAPAFTDEMIDNYALGADPDLYPNSNWWDILIKDRTYNTRHTLNFRGGGEKMRFFVSGAYFDEGGLYTVNNDYNNNAGLKRYNLRTNVDMDVTKTTLITVDLSGQYLQTNSPAKGTWNIFERLNRIPPYLIPPVYSDGTLAAHPSQDNNKVNPYNQLMEYGYRKEWRTGIQSKVGIEQGLDVFLSGLKVRGAISYDFDANYNMIRDKVPATSFATGRDDAGNLIFDQITNETPFGDPSESSASQKNIYMESALEYKQTFDRHDVTGMILGYQKERQLHNDALAYRKQALIGRGTYSFDNRYSIEANFGITGSENFSENYRYGFFPAVGVAWNLTNEPFYPEGLRRAISNFKVRASVGRTGNDNTGGARFMYRPTFQTGTGYAWGIGSSGTLNSLTGLVEGRFESPLLSWEIELKRNIGIDASFLNNRLTIQADYFNNHRTDILMQRKTISGIAGFRMAPWQNFGEVTNKGMDGSIGYNDQIGDVSVSFRGNFTYARNKIIEYDEIPKVHPWMNYTGTRLNALNNLLIAQGLYTNDDFDLGSDGNGNIVYTLRDGMPESTLITNPLPGDIKYADLNGDGVIDDFDRVKDYAHPTVPEIIYGFGLNVGYKGFNAGMFFQGAGNVSTNLNSQPDAFMPFHWGLLESNVRREIVDSRWTPENPSQDVFFPRLRVADMKNTNTTSSWWVRDASFLRLKNVELSYNFSEVLKEGSKLRFARIYIMGQNVAVWDKVKVYDPEMGNSSGGSRYPLPSIWTFGLETRF